MKPIKERQLFWIEIDEDHFVMVNGAWRVRLLANGNYYFQSAAGSFTLDAKDANPVLASLGLTP